MLFINHQIFYFYQEFHYQTLFYHQKFSIPLSQILEIDSHQNHRRKFLIVYLNFDSQKTLNLWLMILSEVTSWNSFFLWFAIFLVILNFFVCNFNLKIMLKVLKDVCKIFGLFFRDFLKLQHFKTQKWVQSEF